MEKCSKCQNLLECKPLGACWCMDYPKIPIRNTSDQCLCSSCLEASFAETINHSIAELSQDMMQSISNSFSIENLREQVDYTINKDGLLQFTKWYLIKRGYCCGNGCYNCPYEVKNKI